MADYGFRVVNDNSFIQIDSTYMNYALRHKASFTLPYDSAGGMYQGFITLAMTSRAVIAWQSTQLACLMMRLGNDIYFRSVAQQGEPPATITVYVFDEPQLAPGSAGGTYGIQVRDASGLTTFDSSKRYMYWLDSFDFYLLSPIEGTRVYPGTNPAVVQGNLHYWARYEAVGVGTNPPFLPIMTIQGVRNSGDSIYLRGFGAAGQQTFNPPPYEGRQEGISYTVIDVSGL